jgi:1-acyl-sn-glycerol-3-phosphate acyltransferase
LRAAVRTVLSCGTVTAYVFVCGPPALLWTVLTGDRRLLYGTASLGVRLGLVLAGISVRLKGAEYLQHGTVYASNHSSNVDSPTMFWALRSLFPKVRVLYKAELRRLPVLVWAFDLAGFVPLERGNKTQSFPAIERAAEAIRQGHSFFIFPEGTRSRTGELLPFKKGGFAMALKAQAPIVPVVVRGGRAAMRKGSPLIWPTTVTVTFYPPVITTGRSDDQREAVIAEVRAVIARGLAEDRNGV